MDKETEDTIKRLEQRIQELEDLVHTPKSPSFFYDNNVFFSPVILAKWTANSTPPFQWSQINNIDGSIVDFTDGLLSNASENQNALWTDDSLLRFALVPTQSNDSITYTMVPIIPAPASPGSYDYALVWDHTNHKLTWWQLDTCS